MNSHQRRVHRRLYDRVMDVELTHEQVGVLLSCEPLTVRLSRRKLFILRYRPHDKNHEVMAIARRIMARDRELLARLDDNPRGEEP